MDDDDNDDDFVTRAIIDDGMSTNRRKEVNIIIVGNRGGDIIMLIGFKNKLAVDLDWEVLRDYVRASSSLPVKITSTSILLIGYTCQSKKLNRDRTGTLQS